MTDERRQQAQRIAEALRNLSSEERARRLERECATDAALRARVEELLPEDAAEGDDGARDEAHGGSPAPEHMPAVGSTIWSRSPGPPPAASGTSDPREKLRRSGEDRPRYVFKGEVGRGGMGAVLKVFDSDLRRNLAMKVVLGSEPKSRAGSGSIPQHVFERFLEEAQITGQLEHPGVVPVHELGVDPEGRMYFTMRLVRGKSFDEVIADARAERDGWNLPRALNALLKICETVAYAHSRRVIHRDLKPSNVMIGRFGETYVMDWGAARLLDRELTEGERSASGTFATVISDRHEQVAKGQTPSATQEGAIIGTPFYMPAEQAAGRHDEIGPHSDVYAVGCMLYQLLAGRRPYEVPERKQSVVEVVNLVAEGPPQPVRELAPGAPPELVAICEKAMAHFWCDRYPDMMRMAEDLRAFLEGRVVSAHSTGTLARLSKWVTRNRALAFSLAMSLVLALGALIGAVVLQTSKLRAVSAQQVLTSQARDQAQANELEAERNAQRAWRKSYVANVIAADASLRAKETLEGKRLLSEAPGDLRGWEWRHLVLQSDTSLHTLRGHAGPVTCVAVDPAGARIASASSDGSVLLWDVGGRTHRPIGSPGEPPVALHFGSDGRGLFTFGGAADPTVRMWDVETGEMLSALSLPEKPVSGVAIDARERRFAFATAGNAIVVVDAETARPDHVLEGHEGIVRAVAFGPGPDRLLSASDDGTVRLWDLVAGRTVRTYAGGDGAVFCLAAHPEEPEFLCGAEDGVVRRWRLDDEQGEELMRHATVVYGVAYGPRAERIASVSGDKLVDVLDLETGELRTLQGHDRPVHCLAFFPDGRFVVTGGDDPELRTWEIDRAEAVTTLHGPEDHVAAVAVDATGGRFALGAHFDGTIAIHDRDARLLDSIPGDGDPVNDLAFSPDGRWLAAAREEDATVQVYSGVHPVLQRILGGHESSVTSVAFRSDGRLLASGSTDFTVRLWDPETGRMSGELAGRDRAVTDVEFQPGGALLAAAHEDGSVSLWEVDAARQARLLEGPSASAYALAWSPDGKHLAVACGDSRLYLWDVADGGPPTVLAGHDQRLSSVAFHPDGERIVSGSYDGSLRVWSTEPPGPLLSLRRHTLPISAVAFSSDGTDLYSASFDNTLRIWRTRD